ncbi:hypothetical protein D3C73_1196850 [compost metagenome]
MLARAKAKRVEQVFALGAAQRGGQQSLVQPQRGVGKQQCQVVVQAASQRRLQSLRGGGAFVGQQLLQQVQRGRAARQFITAARQPFARCRGFRQAFAQALRTGLIQLALQLKNVTMPLVLRLAFNRR